MLGRSIRTGSRPVDPFEFTVQPSCPDCGTVLRTVAGLDVCAECGHWVPLDDVTRPDDDSPGLGGY